MKEELRRGSLSALVVGLLILCFYGIVLFYVLFAVLQFDLVRNFVSCLIFELIGFVLTAAVVVLGLWKRNILAGYLFPMATVTVLYAVLRNVLSIACCLWMPHTWFFLLHLILLFAFLAITAPMYLMGVRKDS